MLLRYHNIVAPDEAIEIPNVKIIDEADSYGNTDKSEYSESFGSGISDIKSDENSSKSNELIAHKIPNR